MLRWSWKFCLYSWAQSSCGIQPCHCYFWLHGSVNWSLLSCMWGRPREKIASTCRREIWMKINPYGLSRWKGVRILWLRNLLFFPVSLTGGAVANRMNRKDWRLLFGASPLQSLQQEIQRRWIRIGTKRQNEVTGGRHQKGLAWGGGWGGVGSSAGKASEQGE